MAIFIGTTLVEARSGFHSIIKEDESCNVSKNNVVTYLSQSVVVQFEKIADFILYDYLEDSPQSYRV